MKFQIALVSLVVMDVAMFESTEAGKIIDKVKETLKLTALELFKYHKEVKVLDAIDTEMRLPQSTSDLSRLTMIVNRLTEQNLFDSFTKSEDFARLKAFCDQPDVKQYVQDTAACEYLKKNVDQLKAAMLAKKEFLKHPGGQRP